MNERIKLLIGYDGSESADAAVEDIQTAGLPRDTEAIVFAVADVWFYPPPADPTLPAPSSPLDRQILRRAEEMQARATQALIYLDDVARQRAARLRALFPSWEIEAESGRGLVQYASNELQVDHRVSAWTILLMQFRNILVLNGRSWRPSNN